MADRGSGYRLLLRVWLAGASLALAVPAAPAQADDAVGAVVQSHPVSIQLDGIPTPVAADQLLYRSTGQLDQPDIAIATVIRPPGATATTRIVSYQMAYDTLGAQCDPSFTLQGGGSRTSLPALEANLVAAYIAAGFTVVLSDYEGRRQEFATGQGSGYRTLDAIRAAEQLLGVEPSTPVGLVGYSGGSIATEFAAELAPDYAPELNILGAAAGGLPVYLPHNIDYIDGSASWASVIPFALTGIGRGFGLDMSQYLSGYGAQIMAEVADQCFTDKHFPGLTTEQLLRPPYQDYRTIGPLMAALERLRMGATGTPRGPLLLGVGNSDGIGDGVMIVNDVRGLAADYCRRGIAVQYREFAGLDHSAAILPFAAAAFGFTSDLFAGRAAAGDCATLT
ncbi:lipase family protein [Nocardia sp. NPDC088792]|uniref:lipase family protein n=1 Tax=Nocardia sp. NPDC088792 TaxID=3364332 RepID=UPI00381D0F79